MIPTLDVSLLDGSKSDVEKFSADIRNACETHGFFYLKNYGISPAFERTMFDIARQFFSRPLQYKMNLKAGETKRGYVPFKSMKEYSSGRTSSENRVNDNFEGFMIRNDPHADVPDDPMYGENVWPSDMPSLKHACESFRDSMLTLCHRLLPIFAAGLDLPRNAFDEFFTLPTISMRLLHYIHEHDADGSYGISPHTDFGFMTLVLQDANGGLEVFSRKTKQWESVPPQAHTVVVNLGDALTRWTNGRYLSTPHRVVAKAGTKERYSIPFFFFPNMSAVIDTFSTCIDPEHPSPYEPITFKDYLMERILTYKLA